MPRKVFFSFHFDRDAWRVGQVRNCNVVQSKYDKNRFLDAADWEQIKRKGDGAIKSWIDSQIEGTSVTIVLIGAQTHTRPWVDYEIEKSWNKGNGMLGVYIHNIKNQFGFTDSQGQNPFNKFSIDNNQLNKLSSHVRTYDWLNDNGRYNIDDWIEAAAKARGR